MNDPVLSPLLVAETPVGTLPPRLFERVYLWTLAALGGLATAALLVFAVAAQSGADAERITGAGSYAEALVSALVTAQSRRMP